MIHVSWLNFISMIMRRGMRFVNIYLENFRGLKRSEAFDNISGAVLRQTRLYAIQAEKGGETKKRYIQIGGLPAGFDRPDPG